MSHESRLFAVGDINAFFGLMLDNVSGLVILAAILTGAFGMPREIVLYRMLPGSAMGVLVGDCSTPGWHGVWPGAPGGRM
jgi:AGZA family xanthine/uracil permease-like MFS transporter